MEKFGQFEERHFRFMDLNPYVFLHSISYNNNKYFTHRKYRKFIFLINYDIFFQFGQTLSNFFLFYVRIKFFK